MGMMLFSQGRVIWRFSILCSAHTCCRPYHMQTCPVSSVLTALFFRNWLVPIYPPGLISFQNTALSLCRWPQSPSFTVSGHRFNSLWSFWVPGFGVYSNKPLRSSWYSQGHLHVYCWLLTVTGHRVLNTLQSRGDMDYPLTASERPRRGLKAADKLMALYAWIAMDTSQCGNWICIFTSEPVFLLTTRFYLVLLCFLSFQH